MVGGTKTGGRAGAKSSPRSGRTIRILIGTLVVIVAGVISQSPLILESPEWPLPNVALWAAAGWGLTGLALRPMLLLIVFGFAQDIQIGAPIGASIVVNLAAFGAAAYMSQRTERETNDAGGLLYASLAIIVGFIALVLLAMTVSQSSPRLLPLFGDLGVTLLLFLVFFPLFNLPASDDSMFQRR